MAKITFETGSLSHKEFKTKEEWENFIEHMISVTPKKKHYDPQPHNLRPDHFPCLMIYDDDATIYRSNGNDEFLNFFVYDYKIEEESTVEE